MISLTEPLHVPGEVVHDKALSAETLTGFFGQLRVTALFGLFLRALDLFRVCRETRPSAEVLVVFVDGHG